MCCLQHIHYVLPTIENLLYIHLQRLKGILLNHCKLQLTLTILITILNSKTL